MDVLSLFDGISCGQVALERVDIKVNNYYASEIDKYAIQVTQKNYPDTIQLGDVTGVKGKDLPKIDLLIGGSPCQGFSFAGKQLNFEDKRSKLFFEFVRLLKETKPKYFLLENVKMKKEYQDIISKYIGVEPIEINSNLVSAQNRKRLYWTNIPNIAQPNDKGIKLKNIVHEYADSMEFWELAEYIVPFDRTLQILDKGEVKKNYLQYDLTGKGHRSQAQRAYYLDGKHGTLTAASSGCKVLFGCITPDRINKRQNGQRFNDGKKSYTLTAQDKHGVLVEGYIRKLTPIECERLQTLPDNYTEGISNSQRYKCLGNGWTVDVIAHILKGII
jgi:DNA (cytosine-5)-methyltransferase 3A